MEVLILYSFTECQIETEPYRSSSHFTNGETETKKVTVTGPKGHGKRMAVFVGICPHLGSQHSTPSQMPYWLLVRTCEQLASILCRAPYSGLGVEDGKSEPNMQSAFQKR